MLVSLVVFKLVFPYTDKYYFQLLIHNTGPLSLGVPGVPWPMEHPDVGRSVNLISTRGDRLCPPNYYWHTRLFRPSDGPVEMCKVVTIKSK